jgi:hypothetical protein
MLSGAAADLYQQVQWMIGFRYREQFCGIRMEPVR